MYIYYNIYIYIIYILYIYYIYYIYIYSDDVHWILLIFLKLSIGFCMVFCKCLIGI